MGFIGHANTFRQGHFRVAACVDRIGYWGMRCVGMLSQMLLSCQSSPKSSKKLGHWVMHHSASLTQTDFTGAWHQGALNTENVC